MVWKSLKDCGGLGWMKHRITTFALVWFLLLALTAVHCFAGVDMTVFGPKRYDRFKGAPNVYTDTFERCEPSDLALLRVTNGNGKETSVTSGEISVNGTVIVSEEDFKQHTFLIEKPIPVLQLNQLKVVLKSSSRETSFVIIEIIGRNCDSTAPVIFAPSPADGALLKIARPTIGVSYRDESNGSGIDAATAKLTVDGIDVTAEATVTAEGVSYLPPTDLSFGEHEAVLSIADRGTNSASLVWHFTTDTVPPEFQITSPISGQYLNTPVISVFGNINDSTARVTLNDTEAQVSGQSFNLAGFSLTEGSNSIAATAVDPAGNIATDNITVILDTLPPVISIASPADGAFVNAPQIDVSGSVDDVSTTVMVNEIAAAVSGKNFALGQFQLVEGLNVVTVEARDRAANDTTAEVRVNLDTVPPEITLTSPPPDSWVNTPLITVSGAVKETNLVGLWINDVATEVSFDDFAWHNFPLVEGANLIKLLVLDKAGNEQTILVPVNLDTVRPSVGVASPIDGVLTSKAQVTVSGTLREEFTSVDVNGIPASVAGTGYTLDYTLQEGVNVITARTVDRAGNTGFATVTVPLDSIAPAPPGFVASPTPTKIAMVTLNGTAEAGSTVKISSGTGTIGTVSADAQGNFTLADVTLIEGANSFTATATDKAENVSAASAPLVVILDTQAPQLAVSTLANGSYTNNATLNISGTALDNVGLQELKVNGVDVAVNADGSYSHAVVLQTGANTVTVVAVDKAGNQTANSRVLNLDQSLPVITIAAPADNGKTGNPIIEVRGSVDNDAVVELKVKETVYPAIMDGLSFTASINAEYGYNTIDITAVDLAGNRSTVKRTVIYDDKQPSLAVTDPGQDIRTNQGSIAIKGTAGDELTAVTITVTMDGQSFTPALANGSFEQTVSFGTEKSYAVTVTATDEVGMTTSTQRNIIYDVTPPALAISPVTSPTNQPTQVLSGTMEEGATVTVSSAGVAVGEVSYPTATTWRATIGNLAVDANWVSVQAQDATGNVTSAETGIIYDDAAPTGSIVVNSGAAVTGSADVSLQLSASDQNGVANMRLSGNGITWTAPTPFSAGASWTLSPGDGPKPVHVQYQDVAGNWSAAFSTGITLDTTAPVVAVAAPMADSFLNEAPITLAGSVNEQVSSVTVNGSAASVVGLGWSLPWTLAEGGNSFFITAVDLAGNSATVAVSVTLDTAAPAVTVAAPAAGLLTRLPQVTVSGTVSEGFAKVTVNGIEAAVTGLSYTLDYILAEGNNVLTVTATDRAGNPGVATVAVTLDSVPPVAPVLNQPHTPTNVATITFNGTSEANSSVQLYSGASLAGTVSADSQGAYEIGGVALAEGANSFTATATDAAGNTGAASAAVNVELDTVLPVVRITSQNDDQYLNTPTVTVSGTLDDPTASVTVNGTPAQNTAGGFTLSGVTLAEGDNTLSVRAVDPADNAGAHSITVHLDTVVPVVGIDPNLAGLLSNKAQVTVSGTVSEEFTSVTVNDIPAAVTGTLYTLAYTLAEGNNVLNVKAADRAGNSGSASVGVTLDSTAPAAPVISASASPTNVATLTLAGTAEAMASVKLYASATLLGTVTADAQGNFTLPNVTLVEGTNSFTASAMDSAGNESFASAPVTVVLDTVPPVITVTAPEESAFFSVPQVSVAGTLDEAVALLTVNDLPVTPQESGFEQTLALTPGANSITLVATDLAGNSATKTVVVTLDSTPPEVTITAPASGGITNAPQVTVTGSISKPHTTATINGTEITVTDQAFSVVYILQEGENTLTVEATDRAGNKGSASATRTLDTQLPVVSLQTEADAAAGSNVAIALNVSDNNRITLVELKADGVPIWSGGNTTAVAESVAYRLSPSLSAGGQVLLQARGIDSAGNIGTASATIAITQGAMGPGYLQGKVLDDTRGLRMEWATVALTGAAGTNLSLASATDGGYFAEAAAGEVLVSVSRPGYTSVERMVAVLPEKKATAIDARLTKINTTANLVGPAGATIRAEIGTGTTKPAIELEIPAGALAAQSDLRLTPVSNQGLAGLLPAGWSPLAVVDLRLLDPAAGTAVDGAFAGAATLKVPVATSLVAPEALLTMAAYDATAHQWLAKGNATLAADGLSVSGSIEGGGQYALVIADPAPNAPAAATAGSTLAAAAAAAMDYETVTAQGKVVPQAAPPATGLKAAGEVVLSAKDGANPSFISGLVLNSRITENFDLKSGDSVQSPSYTQDIVLYRYPCLTSIGSGALSAISPDAALRTSFPVSPSRDYSIVELLLGKVGLEITVPEAVETGVMVGADGGRLVDADGNILAIPQGALSQTVPVSTGNGAAATGAVGADFTLLKVVEVNLTRQTLAQGAVLSIAAPATLDPALPVVLARQIEVKGVAKLKLVALVTQSGTLLSSDTALPGVALSGIITSGNYYFLQAKGPIGFVSGTVTDASDSPYTGALVKTGQGSLVDLTPATGKYLLAAPVALITTTAVDLYKSDEVSGTATLSAANQVLTLDLKILMLPPTLVSVLPTGINVQPSAPVVATFSKGIDKGSVSPATIKLTDADGNVVAGVFTFSVDGKVVTFSPGELLKPEQSYTVAVDGAVKDLQGYSLGNNSTSGFTVRKTTPPPMPPAGAVSGTFPDADGFITVTATQGSAETGNTVLLINDATGEIVSITPASNGSFTGKIRAQLGDEIQVVLMDYSGNRTLISYLTFKSDDGKYLVTAKGGRVEGEGGSLLEIPEGAFVGPTIVRVTTVLEAQLPSALQEPGSYLGAVNIDTGGVSFRKPVEVSIPMPDGFDANTAVFITTPSQIITPDELDPTQTRTENVYQVIDSTKVVGNRISSACPPFDGVWGNTVVFTAFVEVTPVIVSGYTYQDMNGVPGYQPAQDGAVEVPVKDPATGNLIYKYDRPVQRAVVRAPSAWNYVSYTNRTGFYGTFAGMFTLPPEFEGGTNCMGYRLTATHPITMFSHTFPGYVCAAPYNVPDVNFKLAEKATLPPDKEPPVINITASMLPDQGADATYINGVATVGTQLALTITVTDTAMGTANLSAEFMSAEYANTNLSQLSLSDPAMTNMGSVIRYTYIPDLREHAGTSSQIFRAKEAGLVRLIVDARDDAGNASTKSLDIRVVNKGEQPVSMDGAPRITWRSPVEDAPAVRIDEPVKVLFSEGVTGVSNSTFTLYDVTAAQPVAATVSAEVSNGHMKGVLVPNGNLAYGHTYRANLLAGITDVAPNASVGGGMLSLLPLNWQFTTKMPTAGELADGAFAGRDIDYYNDPATNKLYAYVAAGTDGWRVVDITKPESMEVVWPNPAIPAANFQFSTSMDYRHLDVDQETSRLAVTDNYKMGIAESHYGYIRFYSLADPKLPVLIGREKLAEAMSGVPLRVSIHNGYAYVCTVSVGLQVVDIQAAVDRQAAGGATDGSAIVGYFDTTAPRYFGTPLFFAPYRSTSALLTTSSGQMLTLDLSYPTMPTLLTNFQPDDAASTAVPKPKLRFGAMAAVADFAYRDEVGSLKTMDIAVAGLSSGGVRIVDVTAPSDPRVVGVVKNLDGSVASMLTKDITVNTVLGLAVAPALDAVYVIDIRNPLDPRVLNKISQATSSTLDAEGLPVMVNLDGGQAIVERNGKVYLASPGTATNGLSAVKVIDLGGGKKFGIYQCSECEP